MDTIRKEITIFPPITPESFQEALKSPRIESAIKMGILTGEYFHSIDRDAFQDSVRFSMINYSNAVIQIKNIHSTGDGRFFADIIPIEYNILFDTKEELLDTIDRGRLIPRVLGVKDSLNAISNLWLITLDLVR